jgi:hypothetical protein
MIPCCARDLSCAAPHVQSVRFTNLRYFLSQFYDALFDGILHDDRLAKASQVRRLIAKLPLHRSRSLGCQPSLVEGAPLVPLLL